jgi:hypothetical protein
MRNSRFYSILAASTMLVSAAWAQDLAKIQIGD